MPAHDSPAYLVARFLSANNYEKTLDAFIAEANLPPDAGSLPNKRALTIESILEEKRQFDKSQQYSKHGDDHEGSRGWTAGAPAVPQIISDLLPSSANLLCVGIERLRLKLDGESAAAAGTEDVAQAYLLASAADRQVSVLSVRPGSGEEGGRGVSFVASLPSTPLDSPVLSMVRVDADRVVLAAMSGLVRLQNLRTGGASQRRDHRKYVVKVAVYRDHRQEGTEELGDGQECRSRDGRGRGKVWLATAGWDARVLLYQLSTGDDDDIVEGDADGDELGEPVAEIKLQTNPETVLFARDPDSGRVFLLVSRRDSSSIYYYLLPGQMGSSSSPAPVAAVGATIPPSTTASSSPSPSPQILKQAGSQNLAPHSTAWVAFSPAAMALSPVDPTLLAVATSSQPNMRVIIARLLFARDPTTTLPSPSPSSTLTSNASNPSTNAPLSPSATTGPTRSSEPPLTQSSQARAQLALQDREEAALQAHAAVMAPQTAYSTPQLAWRPDGSGVYVNGDDGAVRCVEAATAKVVAVLTGGHEPGAKIRSLWAGWVAGGEMEEAEGGQEEWLVTGGFDRRLVVWRP